MSIIGLSGKKQVGKDLTASIIEYLYYKSLFPQSTVGFEPYTQYRARYNTIQWKVVRFADKLKDIVCLILGCTREQLEDETFKNKSLGEGWGFTQGFVKTPWTPRLLMQVTGTNFGRNMICSDIWVNSTMANYTPNSNWIISDVRFPGEVKAIHDKEGIVIRINRPNIVSTDQHESEIALDDYDNFDYVIENVGDIPELIEKVRDILILEGIIN